MVTPHSDIPPLDLSLLTPDGRRHLRRAVEELRACPEPTPAELLLADGPRRIEDWSLLWDRNGLPWIMSLPEADLDPRLGDFRGMPIAVGPDRLVRLLDRGWARLGAHGRLQAPVLVANELEALRARCAALADALGAEPLWDVAEVPVVLRRSLGLAMLAAAEEPPPSASEWRDAMSVRAWQIDRDRWGLPIVRGMAEVPAGMPHRLEASLLWVLEPGAGAVVVPGGLVKLVEHATLGHSAGAVTQLLEEVARECARLRDALLGEDAQGTDAEPNDPGDQADHGDRGDRGDGA